MCIIAIKKAGLNMPEISTIKNCWYNNPDGAGFCFPRAGMVEIRKGYKKLEDFKTALVELEHEIDIVNTPVILHFRIGTSGGNTPENTHPFPISEHVSALQKLRARAPLAMAHNGVIQITPSRADISDTMEYITSQLAHLYQLRKDFYRTEAGKKMLYNATASKLAFMDGAGNVETVGKFHEKDGILYSNTSYLPFITYKNWDYWDDYSAKYYSIKGKYLTWLCDSDGYIMHSDGSIVEADYYLSDEDGIIYEYDFDIDAAIPTDARLFDHNMREINGFREEEVCWCDVWTPKKTRKKSKGKKALK